MTAQKTPLPFIHKKATGASTPFVFAVPHSGRFYPPDFIEASALSTEQLRRSEDAYVDTLFHAANDYGADTLVATHARAYLDLNRAENELDADMFTPALAPIKLDNSYRVQAGLGAIPQYVAENMPIYTSRIPASEAAKRIDGIHRPYHNKLKEILFEKSQQFGMAFLVDCHSMPSDKRKSGSASPNIILGDCWGSACIADMIDIAEKLFLKAGYSVRRNVPYSGGFSTNFYGAPDNNIHALQIEICRSLYMDETTLKPLTSFENIQQDISSITSALIEQTVTRLRLNPTMNKAAE